MSNDIDFKTWANKNFSIATQFGEFDFNSEAGDRMAANKICNKHKEIDVLSDLHREYLKRAMAALIHTSKKHRELLETRKKNNRAKNLEAFQQIFINKKDITEIAFYAGKKRFSLTDFEFIKGIVGGMSRLYPTNEPAIEVIASESKKVNGKLRGIPDFVHKIASWVDYHLKQLIPKITTGAIIRDIFIWIGLDDKYIDLNQIPKYIAAGKRKYFQ